LTKEGKGCSILDCASLVRVASVGNPSTGFFELYDESVARTYDISNQLVAWLDKAGF